MSRANCFLFYNSHLSQVEDWDKTKFFMTVVCMLILESLFK